MIGENNINLERKRPTHQLLFNTGNNPMVVFVTVCSAGRKPIFANDDFHRSLRNVWEDVSDWKVGYYMIMPDHIHFFCAPAQLPPKGLKNWVMYWKRILSKKDTIIAGQWQNDFWDTQIRSLEDLTQKHEYVRNNPARKGLVNNGEPWLFQGIINELRW